MSHDPVTADHRIVRRARARRLLVPVAAAALLAPVAGCSSDGSAARPKPAPTAGPTATDSPAATSFNPCDGVDAAAVSRALGAGLTKETGTTASPRCALLPEQKGGPTFELSYLWFDQGLEAAWSTMKVPAGTVSSPAVPGADDARLVVNDSGSAYALSAFLQNGALIQTVNVLALAPYDGAGVRKAADVLLRQLSAAAPAS